tara:strand:- start:269 stop:946 length:678 start_codon:yes stop_codon:yes gene_type:complete
LKKYLTLFLTSIFIVACGSKNKKTVQELPVPKKDQFHECKQMEKEEINSFVFFTCNEIDPVIDFPLVSENKVHVAFFLRKAVSELYGTTLYTTEQMLLDCENKEVIKKTIDFKETKNGISNNLRIKNPSGKGIKVTKSKKDKTARELIQKHCPVRKGYERIGTIQYDFKNILKRGKLRNVSSFDGWDWDFTTTIDCKKMIFGINDQPDTPIQPKSLGYSVFKKVC